MLHYVMLTHHKMTKHMHDAMQKNRQKYRKVLNYSPGKYHETMAYTKCSSNVAMRCLIIYFCKPFKPFLTKK